MNEELMKELNEGTAELVEVKQPVVSKKKAGIVAAATGIFGAIAGWVAKTIVVKHREKQFVDEIDDFDNFEDIDDLEEPTTEETAEK